MLELRIIQFGLSIFTLAWCCAAHAGSGIATEKSVAKPFQNSVLVKEQSFPNSARLAPPSGTNIYIPLIACPTTGPNFVAPGSTGSFSGNICVTLLSPPGCNPGIGGKCVFKGRAITDVGTNTRVWFNSLPSGSYSVTFGAAGSAPITRTGSISGTFGSICAWGRKNTSGGITHEAGYASGITPAPLFFCQ
jgi:hypothetical protein